MNPSEFVFITRFYTGLWETIQSQKWNPTGIPTFIKIVSHLSSKNQITWVLVCKTQQESDIIDNKITSVRINSISFLLLPFNKNKRVPKSFVQLISTFQNLSILLNIIKTHKNALFYLDRSNIFLAAILKQWYKRKTVVRILGIYPGQKLLVDSFSYRIRNILEYYCYKRKYDLCIATQDGSGTQHYLKKLIHKKTPKEILLNGVDYFSSSSSSVKDKKVKVVFIGSLQPSKGIPEYIDAAVRLNKFRDIVEFSIVGKGQLQKEIENTISRNNLSDYVNYIGVLDSTKLAQLLCSSDIYISLNKFGSLSNTVLEAMRAGLCILALSKDPQLHIDEFTEEFVPDNIFIRIDRNNIVPDLCKKLENLFSNNKQISEYKNNVSIFSQENIWSWNERCECEASLLRSIC